MATLSAVAFTSIYDKTDASVYTFPSKTYQNGLLYLVGAYLAGSPSAPLITDISGAGLTFTKVGSTGNFAGNARRVSLWRALAASGASTGSIVITCDATSLHMAAVMLQVDGVDTSGTNGSGALGNFAAADGGSGSIAKLDITFTATFASPNNRPLAFAGIRNNTPNMAWENGYATLTAASASTPASWFSVGWNASQTDDIVTATWTASDQAGGLAVELIAGGAAVPTTKTFSIDSLMLKQNISKTSLLDSLLLRQDLSKTQTLDALLLKQNLSLTQNTDALLLKSGIPLTQNLDALLLKQNQLLTQTVDALLLKLGLQITQNVDALLLKQDLPLTHDLDAILASLITSYSLTFQSDALLLKSESLGQSLDALLLKLQISLSTGVDAILRDSGLWAPVAYNAKLWTAVEYNP